MIEDYGLGSSKAIPPQGEVAWLLSSTLARAHVCACACEGHSHCELRLALNRQHCSCRGLLSAGIIDLSHHTPCCGVLFFLKDVLPSPSTFKHRMKFKVCMDREKICTSQLSICLAVLSCHCRVVLGQGTSRDISVLSSLTPP